MKVLVCTCPTPPWPDDSAWVKANWLHRSDCPATYDTHARMNPPGGDDAPQP